MDGAGATTVVFVAGGTEADWFWALEIMALITRSETPSFLSSMMSWAASGCTKLAAWILLTITSSLTLALDMEITSVLPTGGLAAACACA